MAATTWTNELRLGGSPDYDDSSLNYDTASITDSTDTLTVYYDSIGLVTTWSNESQ